MITSKIRHGKMRHQWLGDDNEIQSSGVCHLEDVENLVISKRLVAFERTSLVFGAGEGHWLEIFFLYAESAQTDRHFEFDIRGYTRISTELPRLLLLPALVTTTCFSRFFRNSSTWEIMPMRRFPSVSPLRAFNAC